MSVPTLLRALRHLTLALMAVPALATGAFAQGYPSKTIKLIVPFPAGGGADTLARIITQHMTTTLGQGFVIVNQPGAGGAHAFGEVAKAEPDGHTLVWTSAAFPIMATMIKQLSFDPARDFTHISQIGQNPFVLVINPAIAAKNVAELTALAKSQPGKLTFANNGRGTLTNLVVELYRLRTGIEVAQVAYRGDNFSSNDVVAGHVSAMFLNSTVAFPLITGGKLRALAVTSDKRTPSAPDMPTMQEAGVKDFSVVVWQGISGPARVPRAVSDRLHAAIVKALDVPEVASRFAQLGADRVGGPPDAFEALVKRELTIWADVVKQAGVKVE